jgi:hypothetical protein
MSQMPILDDYRADLDKGDQLARLGILSGVHWDMPKDGFPDLPWEPMARAKVHAEPKDAAAVALQMALKARLEEKAASGELEPLPAGKTYKMMPWTESYHAFCEWVRIFCNSMIWYYR